MHMLCIRKVPSPEFLGPGHIFYNLRYFYSTWCDGWRVQDLTWLTFHFPDAELAGTNLSASQRKHFDEIFHTCQPIPRILYLLPPDLLRIGWRLFISYNFKHIRAYTVGNDMP